MFLQDLKEKYLLGYKFIVVKRKNKNNYLCTKESSIKNSGSVNMFDEFSFSSNVKWPYSFNIIYNIKELINKENG